MKKSLFHVNFFLAATFAIATASLSPTGASAAQWLAPAASDHVTADWVKQIEADLMSEQ